MGGAEHLGRRGESADALTPGTQLQRRGGASDVGAAFLRGAIGGVGVANVWKFVENVSKKINAARCRSFPPNDEKVLRLL